MAGEIDNNNPHQDHEPTLKRKKKSKKKASKIAKGKPIRVLGLTRHLDEDLVLFEWTTGKGYVPYSLAAEHFTELVVDYLTANACFLSY